MHTATLTEIRRSLGTTMSLVRDGHEVVITDGGLPVARIVPVNRPTKLEQLIASGHARTPSGPRRPVSEARALIEAAYGT